MPNPSGSLSIGETIFGSIVISDVLEQGSFGACYLGMQQLPERQVVVKIAHRSLMATAAGAAITERFASEVQALSRVQHERVVSVYMAGHYKETTPMTVLGYVDGQPLAQRLDSRDLPAVTIWQVFHDLGDALNTMHGGGVVHPEFQPSNVVISDDADEGRTTATVRGFGLSVLPGVASMTVDMEQAVRFFAPEQLCDRVDTASNMFSLGAMLWWALTGTPYLSELSDTGSVVQHLVSLPSAPDITAAEPAIPESIAAIVTALMTPTPADRLSAADFCEQWPTVLPDLVKAVKSVKAAQADVEKPSAPKTVAPAQQPGKLIPITSRSSRPVSAVAEATTAAPSQTVLVVDDNLEQLCSLVGFLDDWELLSATNLDGARKQLLTSRVDVILLGVTIDNTPAHTVLASLNVTSDVAVAVITDAELAPELRTRGNAIAVLPAQTHQVAQLLEELLARPPGPIITSTRTAAQFEILALAPLIADLTGCVETGDRDALHATAGVLADEARDVGLSNLASKVDRMAKAAHHGTEATLNFLASAIETEFSLAFRRQGTPSDAPTQVIANL